MRAGVEKVDVLGWRRSIYKKGIILLSFINATSIMIVLLIFQYLDQVVSKANTLSKSINGIIQQNVSSSLVINNNIALHHEMRETNHS